MHFRDTINNQQLIQSGTDIAQQMAGFLLTLAHANGSQHISKEESEAWGITHEMPGLADTNKIIQNTQKLLSISGTVKDVVNRRTH